MQPTLLLTSVSRLRPSKPPSTSSQRRLSSVRPLFAALSADKPASSPCVHFVFRIRNYPSRCWFQLDPQRGACEKRSSLQVTCAVATSAACSSASSGVVLAMNCSSDGVGKCTMDKPPAPLRPCVGAGLREWGAQHLLGPRCLVDRMQLQLTADCAALLAAVEAAPFADCSCCGACSAKALEASICKCCSSCAQSCSSVAVSPLTTTDTWTQRRAGSEAVQHGILARLKAQQTVPFHWHLLITAAKPQVAQWPFAMARVGQAGAGCSLVQNRSLPGCQRRREHELYM